MLMKITSREYKVMLDHRAFEDRKAAAKAFWKELQALAETIPAGQGKVKAKGDFDSTKKREIVFLDTGDVTLRCNGLVLRRREDLDKDEIQYTLKCRSPDRYVAAAADLRTAEGLDAKIKPKLEEDIAAPFRSRYSRSTTVEFKAGRQPPCGDPPETLGDASKLFPLLSELARDGRRCAPDTELVAVGGVRAFERVYTGPSLEFQIADGWQSAEVALILWSHGSEGRPLVAEFSFRYEDPGEEESQREQFDPAVAGAAMRCFQVIQRHDWCRPDGMTKTQYVYRGHSSSPV